MRYEVTSDDRIQRMTDDAQTEAEQHETTFETEQELDELAGVWPMKRMIEVWNSLPGVRPRLE